MTDQIRVENVSGSRVIVPGCGALAPDQTIEVEDSEAIRDAVAAGVLRASNKPKPRTERKADPKPEED